MATHPRTRARGTQRVLASDARLRVLVYAPKPQSVAWIERELGQEPVIIQRARSVEETVSSLIDVPRGRGQASSGPSRRGSSMVIQRCVTIVRSSIARP